MKINVRLYGALRDHLPANQKGRTVLELIDGSTVQGLLDTIGISHTVVIAVNGQQDIDLSHPLNDGDTITVFELVGGG